MRKLVPAFLTYFLFFCGLVHASALPDKPSSRVSDTASMFSAAEREKLEVTLAAFEKETSSQLVVVTVPTLDGQPIEDFSIKLAEKWRIGTKGHDNGVIFLFSKEDRAVRIEVGYGLEGVLPDALAKRIIENEVVPRFKQGDFDGGVEHGVNAILQATRGEYKASANGTDNMEGAAPLIFIALVLYMLIPLVCYMLIAAGMWAAGGFLGLVSSILVIAVLVILRNLLFGGQTLSRKGVHRGGWYSGSGSFGGGGGGFSGGGGGSFGGGGASGRW